MSTSARQALAVIGLVFLQLAAAATNADDVSALSGLQKCISQHSKDLPGLSGWNTSSGSASTATPAAPAAVTAALSAAGIPSTPTAPAASSGGSDPCATVPWTGLLCTGDRVTQVLIAQLAPQGKLSCDVGSFADLSGLSAVESVDFTDAGLTGSLPSAWSSGFDALTSLVLQDNDVEGSLPESWSSGLSKLQTLNLEGNKISGSLPPQWASGFPALINLVLGNNDISGELPTWSGGFPEAQLFGFSNNQLGGVLPDGWELPALSTLELYNNGFYGCLPETWPTNLPNLTHLTVQNNELEGTIPATWGSYDSLTSIAITPGNSFCGTISPGFKATPDGKGVRFDPEPAAANSFNGYDLPACNGATCPTYSYAPGPAPVEAPEAATPASAGPTTAVAGRRLLK